MAPTKPTRQKRRSFTLRYKADAAEYVRKSGKTIAEAARDLDVGESLLRKWLDQENDRSRELHADERAEFEQLRRENEQLRRERDCLKESVVFFATENSRLSR